MDKSITKTVKNRYITPVLFELAMRNLSQSSLYSDWMSFNSLAGDAKVYSLNYENKPLTVSVSEQSDLDIEIRGDSEAVDLFIREMSAEISAITVAELCKCLSDENQDDLKKNLRIALLSSINETLSEYT